MKKEKTAKEVDNNTDYKTSTDIDFIRSEAAKYEKVCWELLEATANHQKTISAQADTIMALMRVSIDLGEQIDTSFLSALNDPDFDIFYSRNYN